MFVSDKGYFGIYYMENPLGNRYTKVNRLSSESFFVFRNDLYVNLLYYIYTCCYAKIN